MNNNQDPNKTVEQMVQEFQDRMDKLPRKTDAEIAAHHAEFDERQREIKRASILAACQLPERYLQFNAQSRSTPPEDLWTNTLMSLAKHFEEHPGAICALCGIRGNGKTQIGAELIKFRTIDVKRSLYVSAEDLFMEIKRCYKPENQESESDVVAKYAAPSLLVLDEVGKRSDNDWENRVLYALLNRRYGAMKDTLLISNQTPEAMSEALGQSLTSRINQTGVMIHCQWPSFR